MTDSPTNEGDITPSESTPPHPPEQQSPAQPQEAPTGQQQPVVHVTQQVVAVKPSNGVGTAAGVLGIVGIALIWVPFIGGLLCLLGLILGIVGLVKGRNESLPVGMAITGIATGGVGVLIYVVLTIFVAASGTLG